MVSVQSPRGFITNCFEVSIQGILTLLRVAIQSVFAGCEE